MAVPPLAANDIVQVIIRQNAIGQVLLNVLHYWVVTPPSVGSYFEQLEDIGTVIKDGPGAGVVKAMKKLQGAVVTHDWVQVQRINPRRDVYVRVANGDPGEATVDADTVNVAAVLTKQTEGTGRGRSGSFHIGGLSRDFYALGSITNAGVLLMDDVGAAIVADVNTAVGGGILRPCTYQPNGIPPANRFDLLNVFSQVELRTMRRRTLGVGI